MYLKYSEINSFQDTYAEDRYIRTKYMALTSSVTETDEVLKELNETISSLGGPANEEFKANRSELLRVRALLNFSNNRSTDACKDLQDAARHCDNHFKTWKSWLLVSFAAYLRN